MPAGSALSVERVASFDELAEEWVGLAEASGNLFATREWLETWWRHLGRGTLLLLACRTEEGRLAAILPLYRRGAPPFRILRFLGHGPGDQLGPIHAPADAELAAEGLRRVLAPGGARWDFLLAEQLLATDGWRERLGATLVRTTGFPTLRFEHGSWDELMAARSAHFRRNLRQRQRKLEDEHEVRYRLTQSASELERDLDVLYELHARRWEGHASPFVGAEREAFHRDFARQAFERGWLRLWLLELSGRPVAAWYGFRFGGAEYFYQGGRDPDFDRLAVGQLILVHSIRAALEDGVEEYRFLRGDEGYKYNFANVDPELEILARARGPARRAALAAVTAAARSTRVREVARKLLRA